MGCLVQCLALAVGLMGAQRNGPSEYPGQMYIVGRTAMVPMPLERTKVNADVVGMGARVTVRQEFKNTSETPIEAIYTFPLPHDAAIDRMNMVIGARIIHADIMRREKAKQVYDQAKQQGHTAALLDQETDNIFTQSVANIMPGQKVEVEISYVQLLKFEDGQYEFHFPMVVGPRFLGAGTPNPAKVATPTLPYGVRSGQNVRLSLDIHGGVPIRSFTSVLHQVNVNKIDGDTLHIELANRKEIPNRDFILRYKTAGDQVQDALFTTWDPVKGGYFALVLCPPAQTSDQVRGPKEMVFVLDQSGSQSGFPIEKSKILALKLMDTMKPGDTFNVMGFSNNVNPLWPCPRPNTPENQDEARKFIKSIYANGGTELEKAIVASLSPELDPNRLRIVLFNTDGYAGQEPVILRNIQQYRGLSRLFTFGIGNSVNRSLIDAMSYEGRGGSEVVTLEEKADEAVARFAQRLESPVLVDIHAKFDGDLVQQVTPKQIPDVFSAKPVVIYGRYSHPGQTKLTLSGIAGGHEWSRVVSIDLPKGSADGNPVSSLWARTRLSELKSESYTAAAFGKKQDVSEQMTQIALDHRLMSEYTSFVAVDSAVSNTSGQLTSVQVPVDMPQGVSMGANSNFVLQSGSVVMAAPASLGKSAGGGFGGMAGGFGGGMAGGSFKRTARGGRAQGGTADYDGRINSPLVGKLEAGLDEIKGPVEIQIGVNQFSTELLAKIKKTGAKVLSFDGASVIYAKANLEQIKALAKIESVYSIVRFRSPMAG